MTRPVIIEVALNGATPKERNPHVPREPREVVADAIACIDAGASIVHSHIDDIVTAGEEAASRYAAAYRELRAARPHAIVYPTVVFADDRATKFTHLAPLARARLIDQAAFDPGSTNFGFSPGADGLPGRDVTYINSYDDIRYAFALFDQLGLGGSLAIYEPSFLRATLGWHRAGKLPRGSFVKFYFGGGRDHATGGENPFAFGLPPTEKALEAYLEMFAGSELPWATAVPGGDLVASGMAQLTLARGGHLRVGLEDYAGAATPSNAELVAEAVGACKAAGCSVATAEQARAILGMSAAVKEAAW